MKNEDKIKKAAQLLGRRGGSATLKKYGAPKLREWGERGAKFGKLGGRPTKSKAPAKSRICQPKAGANE